MGKESFPLLKGSHQHWSDALSEWMRTPSLYTFSLLPSTRCIFHAWGPLSGTWTNQTPLPRPSPFKSRYSSEPSPSIALTLCKMKDEENIGYVVFNYRRPNLTEFMDFFRANLATVKQLEACLNCTQPFLPREHLDTDGTVAA
ncbi:hypothetical protein NPIL_440201 [Nephila pilipes]|uniref:Uncharacterized protein n=1 Tax=Nephila pilipes TaxID=299642 RepID=A0A8X6UUI0_NEPPI|nr:hypothetical protein NPIL_440201 [Nephila pilipes]